MNTEFIFFNRQIYNQSYQIHPHVHPCFELVYYLSGEGTVNINNVDYKFKPNCFAFTAPQRDSQRKFAHPRHGAVYRVQNRSAFAEKAACRRSRRRYFKNNARNSKRNEFKTLLLFGNSEYAYRKISVPCFAQSGRGAKQRRIFQIYFKLLQRQRESEYQH